MLVDLHVQPYWSQFHSHLPVSRIACHKVPSASTWRYTKCRYTIGKVIGAGSFGVVREAVHKRSNVHYACKTIPKLPKKGRGTPRYLLKIQTEVDAMLQLGPSLDAVFLQALLLASQTLVSPVKFSLYPPT